MQPKAVTAGFIAADHRRLVGEPEPALRAGNLLEYAIRRAGGHLADPRTLTEADCEAQLPGAFTELEREQQRDRRRGRRRDRLVDVGRGLHRYALLVE
jgi:hypothetical protein